MKLEGFLSLVGCIVLLLALAVGASQFLEYAHASTATLDSSASSR